MSIKWGEEKLKELSSPVKKAEEVNDWSWWVQFGTIVIMEILFVLKVLGKI